ncbi:hypothetical protein [Mesorhizobium sp.]|uniref:hypothetical protein n=1 Tax=Mesorhizobium sp. TaxID=1871066 RepID=UPI000FE678D6|nr:hypothetical protein [Mesorhizobium sp.]RWQ60285.1 MAG: hypothetical protein EOS83_07305 [Mesorhizobium sp.]
MTTNETSTDYRDVVVTLNKTTRIINCRHDIQWIVQTLSGGRWRSSSFWRRRDALIDRLDFEASHGNTGYALTAENRKALEALPRIHRTMVDPPSEEDELEDRNWEDNQVPSPIFPLEIPRVYITTRARLKFIY